jgi:EAL and modified HD-GYP domain-containing signal transduction protein
MDEPVSPRLTPDSRESVCIFVSRHPIYDHSINVFSYELLYQSENPDLKTLLSVDPEPFLLEGPAFVNVSGEFILNNHARLLPRDRFVLVMPGDVEATKPMLRSIVETHDAGCGIASRNITSAEYSRDLLEHSDYCIVDFSKVTPEQAKAQTKELKKFGAKLIANQLQSYGDFEKAKDMGFEYFGGPCFLRPRTATADGIPPNRVAMLQLIQKLQEPEFDMADLETIISRDVAISYKLLRYVNSALISLPNNIESIKHAVQLVGTQRIRLWSSILIMFGFDDKPSELVVTAFLRATMAKHLAEAMDARSPESYFTAGLFSVMDAMLDLPMKKAVELIPLASMIRDALTDRRGLIGMVLACVLAYEAGDWTKVRCGNLTPEIILRSYLDSIIASQELRKIAV